VSRVVALLRSSLGRKLLMAASGLALVAFLLVHLIGNLYVFQGREALNAYAAWLKANPLLWPARIGLLAAFGLHVWLGVSLARENRAARPVRYAHGLAQPARTLASRSMALSGAVVLAFVIYHLAHFTFGAVQPEAHSLVDAKGRHDVYGMVVAGFRNPWVLASYLAAVVLLGAHLAHAVQSALQTFGVRYRHGQRLVPGLALAVVAAITLGNLALPVGVFLGFAGSAEVGAALATAGTAP
jgi:succinate dehydrogenase / fumarate reductase cytochrome b subunit